MNIRHHNQLNHPLMTRIVSLNQYLVSKSSQSRRLVQVNYINTVLGKACTLFYLGMDYLDGLDTLKRMKACLYDIQKGAYLISVLEDAECKKRLSQNIGAAGKPKKRKHYGFDTHAVAHIDISCDEILSVLCSYGQHSLGRDKSPVTVQENDKGLPTCPHRQVTS